MFCNLICWMICRVKVREERSPIRSAKDLVKFLKKVVHQDSLCQLREAKFIGLRVVSASR